MISCFILLFWYKNSKVKNECHRYYRAAVGVQIVWNTVSSATTHTKKWDILLSQVVKIYPRTIFLDFGFGKFLDFPPQVCYSIKNIGMGKRESCRYGTMDFFLIELKSKTNPQAGSVLDVQLDVHALHSILILFKSTPVRLANGISCYLCHQVQRWW